MKTLFFFLKKNKTYVGESLTKLQIQKLSKINIKKIFFLLNKNEFGVLFTFSSMNFLIQTQMPYVSYFFFLFTKR